MNRDHQLVTISEFNGLFHRGTKESCPPDHFPIDDFSNVDCPNLIFDEKIVSTRPGFDVLASYAGGFTHPPKRFRYFIKTDGTKYRIILDSNNHLWSDSTDLGSLGASVTDFELITLGNRAYICPFGDNGVAITGKNVKVFDGTTLRDAGGAAPAVGTFAAATSATAGVIEKGLHLIAVAYETDSGFITPPCTAIQYTAPGAKKIDLTNIPTGPAGTLYRHILITKYIKVFDGNVKNYMLYKIAKISDNTTTSLTIDQYDSALIDQAGYLYDELATIPAGVHLGVYRNCLVSAGAFGEDSVVRVSKPGDFESFSSVDGFLTVAKNDGGGVKNTAEFRGSLYMFKSHRTFATADNGGPINSWTIQIVDAGIGCEPHGIGKISGASGPGIEGLFIASHAGLMYFQGIYQLQNTNLTWKIQKLWDDIDLTGQVDLIGVEVLVDASKKSIYLNLPFQPAAHLPTVVLVGDYKRGLDPKLIRWNFWCIKDGSGNSMEPYSMAFGISDAATFIPLLVIAFKNSVSANAKIMYLSTGSTDNSVAFQSKLPTALFPETGRDVNHFGMVRARMSVVLSTAIAVNFNGDAGNLTGVFSGNINGNPVELRWLCNYQDKRGRLIINNTAGAPFSIYRIDLYVKKLWGEVPA